MLACLSTVYLRNLTSRSMLACHSICGTCPQKVRQTHGRGYMYLAQSVHIVHCKAADLCWRLYLRNLSTDRQTDRQTHGRGYMYLAGSVHIVYCKAVDLCWCVYLCQELVHRQTETDRQTHGRGYMYLAHAVHKVRCKVADLCWRLYLSRLYLMSAFERTLK